MISIALFEPQIPPNTGNIARLSVGLDIELFLIGKLGFSINDRYLKRAGLDYWEHLKLSKYDNLNDFTTNTSKRRKVLATTKGRNPYYNFNYLENDIIIFGSETSGLPIEYIKDNIENTISIPMPGRVRSLNLSNSAAVIIYHALNHIKYFNSFEVNRNYYEYFSDN